MWQPSPEIIAKVIAHAEQTAPRECCGLIRGADYIPIANVAPQDDAFLMRTSEFLAALRDGPIDAVAHSHVFLPPVASETDLTSCEASRLPWLIVSIPNNTHTVIRPSGFRAPLVGRTWGWGVHDCFSLVRDGISAYAAIEIPNIDREWEFWRKSDDFIRASMPAMGFVELPPGTPLQHLDVLGMKVHGRVVNHLGLFIAPDRLLHQMAHRPSVMEIYGGTYQAHTELHARHVGLMEGVPDAFP